MADQRSYIALDWVTDEIRETLKQALEALEGYVANADDITRLRFCQTYVHQVTGSLTMVELHGASLLAKEAETLIGKMLGIAGDKKELAVEQAAIVRKALNELVDYIGRVSETHEDRPKELLGIMNEVRTVNDDEEAFSAADVFNPDIAPARKVAKQKPRMAPEEFNELIRKLRQAFHVGLVGLVKGVDTRKNLQLVNKVCASLFKVSKSTVSQPLWQIANAISDHLVNQGEAIDDDSKKALKLIDGQIRVLEEQGVEALGNAPESNLLKSLLYSVATAEPVTDQIRELREQYQLDAALAEEKEETQRENKIIDRVLLAVSDTLEKLDAASATALMPAVGNALAMLGKVYEPVVAQAEKARAITASAAGGSFDKEAVAGLAKQLAELDTGEMDGAAFMSLYRGTINESRAVMEAIKEQISSYLGSGFEKEPLEELPSLIEQQMLALNISTLVDLLPLLDASRGYLADLIAGSAEPDSNTLEMLADVISSVDYYLECVTGESRAKLDSIVIVAEQRLESMGRPPAPLSDIPLAEEAIPTLATGAADDTEAEPPLVEPPVAEPEAGEAQPVQDTTVTEDAGDDVFVLGDEADEEIVEIFIEEGGEVLEQINENLPQLEADYDNMDALLEVRRSFHTLKGSGRMIGATHVGDFAWSVERMLNKVRDGGGKVTDNCIDVIKAAVEKIPGLLKSLEDRTPYPLSQIRPVIARADAEWEGKPITAQEAAAGETQEAEAIPVAEVEELAETQAEPVAEAEQAVEEEAGEGEEQQEVDSELLDIFVNEAETHLGMFAEFLDQINPGYEDVQVSSELQRALHTLKGSAYMAGVHPMADLVAPLESFVKDMANFHTTVDSEMLALFIQANELLNQQLERIRGGDMTPVEQGEQFLAELKVMHASRVAIQEAEAEESEGLADKYTALLSEALDCMTEGGDLITEWQAEGLDRERQEKLVQYMARLGETASGAGYPEVAAVSTALADFYRRSIDELDSFGPDFFDLANRAHDELDDMMDIIAAQQVVEPADDLIAELKAGVFGGGEQAPAAAEVEKKTEQPESKKAAATRMPMVAFANQLAEADKELLEIFEEETGELLESLEPLVNGWLADTSQPPPLDEMKRILHTLKGGSRMAELPVMGDLTHAYESRLEKAEADENFDAAFAQDVENFQSQLLQLVDFALGGGTVEQAEAMEARWAEQAQGETEQPEVADVEEPEPEEAVPVPEVVEQEEEPASEAPAPAEKAAAPEFSMVAFANQLAEADKELLEIFEEEAGGLMESLEPLVEEWLGDTSQAPPLDEMKRVLHTLKGGARMAELSVLGDLTHAYESRLEKAEATGNFDTPFAGDVGRYQKQLLEMVDFALGGGTVEQAEAIEARWAEQGQATAETQAATSEPEKAAEPAPAAEVSENTEAAKADSLDSRTLMQAVAEEYRKADDETLEIFLEEATELASELEECGSEWLADHDKVDQAEPLKRILHTIKGGARMAELPTLGTLTHDYESMIEHATANKAFDQAFFGRMQAYQDQIQALVEFIANGAQAEETAEATPADDVLITTPGPAETAAEKPAEGVELEADFDPELLELFVEEANEQSEGIEEAIANFLENRSSEEPLEELKRLLHTLKGGARMAGVNQVGDLSHDFETFIINNEREKTTQDEAFVDGMQSYHEQLTKQIASISSSAAAKTEEKQTAEAADNVVPIRPDVSNTEGVSQAAIDATRNFIENFRKEQQRSTREPIKISPDLLDNLINLAGESIIGRSRIEEQISELRFSIDEMDVTVDRLHAQLRRLEIETEAQIVFRQEQVVSEGQENFDPLEMDRYTHMQQLSKSLIEAASDIDDLSGTFTNKMRDMETLLLQQSRINSELQEGLMRCQMVPFSRMVPRLRRIVRQVAQELGKKVEFSVENAEGELDRSILERMIAPLEHMLRNAVDHGIEMPDVRKKAGKKETGSIVLSLSREGGEVVLTLSDNGGGINLEAVRNKAIERGLMVDDASLSDHEVLQFILHAGFSTAQKVTQISGRGVGMDVVHSEIKQMGGSVEITSEQGQGTNFIVRLPFTVSVNRALMVCIGNDTFAIPLNTIEGIVRVSPYELEAYYQPDAPMFEYAGQSYHLRYMGTLLHRGSAKIEEQTMPLPVILIRSSDYAMAVQVDRLLGSREVVVKSLGPQFSMVDGVSGATVLGDGSVVIILDMMALIRSDVSRGLLNEAAALAQETYVPPEEVKATTVMVVDDSVTVRKVTSRLLERFGLEVVLAKDGLDAITQLQDMDTLPDIMLLDIEMPRMDGFEVVNRVRHNNRLQNIPIVMITSRTGEKHRERALSLGASRYLGKPFQERELLQVIGDLTGAEILQA